MAGYVAMAEIPARPPPRSGVGPLVWVYRRLFNSWFNAALTLLILWAGWSLIPPFVEWAFIDAVWGPAPPDACRVEGAGACWAFVTEKYQLIFFSQYPRDQLWRPIVACLLLIGLVVGSTDRRLWSRWLATVWVVVIVCAVGLMYGGVLGLPIVETQRWGGLPLTLGLSVIGLACAFPLSILLALGRRSHMPAIRTISVAYIELIRGVPLITVLFMATVMFPLFMPTGVNIDGLLRAQIGLIMFAAAYLAEVVRGGLQAIPKGQYEAADALGLGYWRRNRLIILPQALRIAIPPLVNTFIGFFKDTTLVIIVGLFDLLGAARQGLVDPPWGPFSQEAYLFVSLVFFVFCFSMSRYSRHLERTLNSGVRRR